MRTAILLTLAALATACAHQDSTPDASGPSTNTGVTNAMPGTPAAGDPNATNDEPARNGSYATGAPAGGLQGTPMNEPPLPPAPPNDTSGANDKPATTYAPSTMGKANPNAAGTFSDAPAAQTPNDRAPGNKPIVAEEHPYAPAPGAANAPAGHAPNVTATSQSNAQGDVKLVGAIRRAMSADPQLSFAAKNVTVVTNGGNVYLRGTVKTVQERDRVESIAMSQAGVGNIDNGIVVKP